MTVVFKNNYRLLVNSSSSSGSKIKKITKYENKKIILKKEFLEDAVERQFLLLTHVCHFSNRFQNKFFCRSFLFLTVKN